MFGWEFPPYNSGGLGTACFGLSKALAQKDLDVIFVLPRKVPIDGAFLKKMRFANEEHVRFKTVEALLYPYLTSESYKELAAKKAADDPFARTLMEEVYRYGERARQIAKEEQFDIIHAHDWLSFIAGLEAKAVSGKPLVLHVHATEFDRTGGQGVNQQVYDIERSAMAQADRVIAVSNFTKEKIVRHYGIDADKITVVHNGVEMDEWRDDGRLAGHLAELKRNGTKIVLYNGRITIQKGPEYFVRAAKKALAYEPNTLYVVSGSGDMQNQMMREAAYLGLSDKMLFVGFLRGEELKAVYRAADLFIMPSVSEPFGITPLESIASGVPVIVSKQSGVSEILAAALKVDFWDTDEMANMIVNVLRHGSLHETLRTNGFSEVARHTWERAAQKCVDVYTALIRKTTPQS